MNLDTSKWSRTDYTAAVALLHAETCRLEATLASKLGNKELSKIPARPVIEGTNIYSYFDMMAAHVVKLKQLAGLNADTVTNLPPVGTAPASSAPSAVAAAPSPTAAPSAATSPVTTIAVAAPAFNPDAQVLAARGVPTLAELNKLGPMKGIGD